MTKTLAQLLERLEYTCVQGSTDIEIQEVLADSRKAKEGSLFICIKGAVKDGHDFKDMVVAFGVSIIAIKFLMGYIKNHDFKVFGWYRIVLGVIVLAYFMIWG